MKNILRVIVFVIAVAAGIFILIGVSNLYLDKPLTLPEDASLGKTASFVHARKILERDCLVCHSSQTVLPWYGGLPVVKQLIESDIKSGRHEMNIEKRVFTPGLKPTAHTLKEIRGKIRKSQMPPLVYKVAHWRAFLSEGERKAVLDWIEDELNSSDAQSGR